MTPNQKKAMWDSECVKMRTVPEEFGACFVQACDDILRFRDVVALPKDNWVALAEDAVRCTERKVEKTKVKNGPKEAGDGELRELRIGVPRDVFRRMRRAGFVSGRRSRLREGGA